MTFASGSLVRSRGREWVVLPESTDDLLMVRPLGGTDDEVTGILTELETVEPATFDLPDPDRVGDYVSARLLRDALRLGFRSSAGPFRSFGRLLFEPRPYQLVPLLMALRQDPVRILISDDVGIGKTVEALLIARELLDQGTVNRLAVLCPPHLAEQWQEEIESKFQIDAKLVLASTAAKLERECLPNQTLFELHPHVVVSTDFIKSEKRRTDFLRTCPELVVVDEAHTCAFDDSSRSTRHQRHELLRGLAKDQSRHVVLVTATPHSGNEAAFRSLLTLLHPSLEKLPDDLSGPKNEKHRRELAKYFVQRRRRDIREYLKEETPFPEREEKEETYSLSKEYRGFFDDVIGYARETVQDEAGGKHRQRVRWWSALALLRAIASSPAAAHATLQARSKTSETADVDDADEVGRRTVLDEGDEDEENVPDDTPGSDPGDVEETKDDKKRRRVLADFAKQAEKLYGDKDAKLVEATKQIKALLQDGHRPIVFCRFIATAEYLTAELRSRLPKNVQVEAVTGRLAPAEREDRVKALAESEPRVLVATDCLSEGINLQDYFDAVMHYDLSWNPTRHEQREGRVDRFGQAKPTVRVLTFYGKDNGIDGIVLDVLLRKHIAIRSSTGISVPVPADANTVVEAILEGILLRRDSKRGVQLQLFEDELHRRNELHEQWEDASDKEKRSRTMFAQETIKPDEVAPELEAARAAVGSGADTEWFVRTALAEHRAAVNGTDPITINLGDVDQALRDALPVDARQTTATFNPTTKADLELHRAHQFVESLAAHVLDSSLDSLRPGVAARAGAIRTKAVKTRTTLLLVRYRMHLIPEGKNTERPMLAEDAAVVAFTGSPTSPKWLPPDEAEALLAATPDKNIAHQQASEFVREVVRDPAVWSKELVEEANRRASTLRDAHTRVRQAAKAKGVRYKVEPQLPPDVLGVYVHLPA